MDVTGEICGRCLINPDTRVRITAHWGDGQVESAPSLRPDDLLTWAHDMLYGNHARFEVDNTVARFTAVSSWHGDPVCSYHLWVLAEAEMRRGYG